MKFISFFVQNQAFAIELEFVERIVLAVELISFPHTQKNICGAVDVHGEIIPVMAMGELLGFPAREMELSDNLIICFLAKVKVALLVDQVNRVVDYSSQDIQIPEKFSSVAEHVRYVIKDNNQAILVCDWEKLCHQNLVIK